MASWMIHFRVAQAMLDSGALGDHTDPSAAAAFVLGNVAPDSGVPTPDGRYAPDKKISHFMRRFEGVPAGQNPKRCDPVAFAREWVEPSLERGDPEAAAFYLGYLCHLVTDNAWVRDFIYPAKETFAHLRLVDGVETPEGVARFYGFLKKDWYDMDFLYIKRHPDLPAYRLFLDAPAVENRFLPFFPADAFARKREEMEEFYATGAATVEERAVYIRDEEAEGFILGLRQEILDEYADLFSDLRQKITPFSPIVS